MLATLERQPMAFRVSVPDTKSLGISKLFLDLSPEKLCERIQNRIC